jgi:glycine dehydrogenase
MFVNSSFLKRFYRKPYLFQTRSTPIGILVGNHQEFDFLLNLQTILQYPGKHGQVYDYADFIKKAADNEKK